MSREWQPIETVPKDGTVIDVYCRKSWNPPEKYVRRTDVYWCTTHNLFRFKKNLHFVDPDFNQKLEMHLIPTHWMPLPDKPKEVYVA